MLNGNSEERRPVDFFPKVKASRVPVGGYIIKVCSVERTGVLREISIRGLRLERMARDSVRTNLNEGPDGACWVRCVAFSNEIVCLNEYRESFDTIVESSQRFWLTKVIIA